jgi:hypothetical protein
MVKNRSFEAGKNYNGRILPQNLKEVAYVAEPINRGKNKNVIKNNYKT